MAGVRLWTLSAAERSILIICSSEQPYSWLKEIAASSAPEIPNPPSHPPGAQRQNARLCPAQLGNIVPVNPGNQSDCPAGSTAPVLTHGGSAFWGLTPRAVQFPLRTEDSRRRHGRGWDPAGHIRSPCFWQHGNNTCASLMLLRSLTAFWRGAVPWHAFISDQIKNSSAVFEFWRKWHAFPDGDMPTLSQNVQGIFIKTLLYRTLLINIASLYTSCKPY